MAAINALIYGCVQIREKDTGDTLERVDIRNGDQVYIIGCFLPTSIDRLFD
jgi:hypothetical protein